MACLERKDSRFSPENPPLLRKENQTHGRKLEAPLLSWFVADGSIALAELVVLDEEVRVLDVIDEEVDGRVVVVVNSDADDELQAAPE
jgi:hypothetical protein